MFAEFKNVVGVIYLALFCWFHMMFISLPLRCVSVFIRDKMIK